MYLALTKAPDADGRSIGLRVIVQPLIVWLWVGGIVMVLGTLLALFPGRRRNPLDPVSTPAATSADKGPVAGGDSSAEPDDEVREGVLT